MTRVGVGPAGKVALCCGAAAWAGAVLGLHTRLAAVPLTLVIAAAGLAWRRWAWVMVVAALAGGVVSGAGVAERAAGESSAPVPERTATLEVIALDDARPGDSGPWLRVRPVAIDGVPWAGPALVASGEGVGDAEAGERWELRGAIRPRPGTVRGDPVAGRISVRRSMRVSEPGGIVGAAAGLRHAVLAPLEDRPGPASALLAGFLVGDTRRLPAVDVEALRRAGLSHFVAVSGSNVALFLGLWWLVLGPSWRWPRLRPVLGLAGLVLFVLVTRWEPSVVRAAAMAGVVLLGRLAGVPIDLWTAMGVAVTGALLVSGELAVDLGFALSVAATVGVVVGARLAPPRWGRIRTAVAATAGAQVAVTPLLLGTVGSLPLMSPLTNLAAAPLVTAATALGGLGAVAGAGPLIDAGLIPAGWVLTLARMAAPWPQLGPEASPWIVGALGLSLVRPLRPFLAAAGVAALGVALIPSPTPRPAVVVLDVGQGDSILLLAADAAVLVDGGPDPALLSRKLAEHGVEKFDLVVVTHPHADHTTGLQAVLGRVPVGRVWDGSAPHTTPAHQEALEAAWAAGVPVERPPVGRTVTVGSIALEVLGPTRRYAGPNDQSVVLLARLGGLEVLLAGDIEVPAQADLGSIRADVLKVPHQGAATSDRAWLEASAGRMAVISVGPNDFGHPSPWVIEALEEAGARVLRTDRDGDVVIRPP